MKVVKGQNYGVVTGDIVNSSKLPVKERKRLFDEMRSGSAEMRQFFGERIPMDVDIFRGDSWQFVVTRPADALRAGLLYRAYIKAHMLPAKLDSRLVIAIGGIDFIADRVSESDGEVFRLSGKTLETLDDSVCMRLVAPHLRNADELDAIVQLLDVIARRWTPKQALAVSGALRGWKQEKILSLWQKNIAQPTVVKHLNAAEWQSVGRAIAVYEKLLN
ncbi:hypothetical protein JXQ31_12040 [candidate division KSB1 bacterium]|nr:hypothetical protein [candidate division KSB1 bacterium]